MISRIVLALSLLASWAGTMPAWFPRTFAPHPEPTTELSRYLAAERLDIADSIHAMGTVEVDGIRIAVHGWIPANATGTVFLVHGYYSQSGVWSPHIRRLLDRGFAVVAFDLPGHGLSDGRRMDIDSFGQYPKALLAVEESMDARAPRPWMLAAHSLGGAVALERARRPAFPYARVALLAPMIRYENWTSIGLALPAVSLFKERMTRGRKLSSSSDTAFLERIVSDPLEGWFTSTRWLKEVRRWNATLDDAKFSEAEWMLLQGGLDKTVDWKWNMAWLQRHIPVLETRYLPLGRHQIHNEGGLTGAAARKIFDDFLSRPLPKQEK